MDVDLTALAPLAGRWEFRPNLAVYIAPEVRTALGHSCAIGASNLAQHALRPFVCLLLLVSLTE